MRCLSPLRTPKLRTALTVLAIMVLGIRASAGQPSHTADRAPKSNDQQSCPAEDASQDAERPPQTPHAPVIRYNPHASASASRTAKSATSIPPAPRQTSQGQQVIDLQLGRPTEAVPNIPNEVVQLLPPGCLETWSGPSQSGPSWEPTAPQNRSRTLSSPALATAPAWALNTPSIAASSQVDLSRLGDLNRLDAPVTNDGDALLDYGAGDDPLSNFESGADPLGDLGPSDPGTTPGAPAITQGGTDPTASG